MRDAQGTPLLMRMIPMLHVSSQGNHNTEDSYSGGDEGPGNKGAVIV